MQPNRQKAVHLIVDLINEALDGDGFPLAQMTADEQHAIKTAIEDITMELLETLPMPKPVPITNQAKVPNHYGYFEHRACRCVLFENADTGRFHWSATDMQNNMVYGDSETYVQACNDIDRAIDGMNTLNRLR